MSDKAVEDFNKKAEELRALEAIKQDTTLKKIVLDNKRINQSLKSIQQNEQDLAAAKNIHFGVLSPEEITRLQNDNADYLEAAKNSMDFILGDFKKVVPFFRKNLILVCGNTGDGKSMTVANLALSVITQSDRANQKFKKVLIITNEEKPEDFYNRLTCLIKGWHYVNHNEFTDAQRETFNRMIPSLAQRVVVIHDSYGGTSGLTTTVEGISTIFDNLIRDQIYYDAVLIDYYQTIASSKENPSLDQFKVQAKLALALDQYKNSYPAPIVLMAQLYPTDPKSKTPFQQRIKGTKMILDKVTCALEMIAVKDKKKTEWILHKGRYSEFLGKKIETGYKNGKIVKYDDAFITEAQQAFFRKEELKTNKENADKLKALKEETKPNKE